MTVRCPVVTGSPTTAGWGGYDSRRPRAAGVTREVLMRRRDQLRTLTWFFLAHVYSSIRDRQWRWEDRP